MLLRRLNYIHKIHSRCVSALYLTGDKAKESYAILTPFMDFEARLSKLEDLKSNFSARKINLNYSETFELYQQFKRLGQQKKEVENERSNISERLKKSQDLTDNERETLKEKGRELRDALKSIKEATYPIEDKFFHNFLNLPNDLHLLTPETDPTLIYRQGIIENSTETTATDHLQSTDLIDFKNEDCCYLKNEAALFDLNFPLNCVEYVIENNFVQFINPDFARSILVEAAGINLNAFHEIAEDVNESKVNLLHLVGNGSFISFLAFITKLSVYPTLLPLKFVAQGRGYSRSPIDELRKGLYTATQSNKVHLFVATKSKFEADEELENSLGLCVDIYRKLGIHFRIVYTPADKLSIAESLRSSIQVYSPIYREYIEVGWLSHFTDFISKRLLFNFKDKKEYRFPHIVAGEIVDVSKILACLIENKKKIIAPNFLRPKSKPTEEFMNLFTT